MNIDRINQLIEDSDLNKMQKNINLGFIFRAKENEDKKIEARDLIEKVYGKCTVENIPIVTDEVIIFKIIGKKDEKWDLKYPYRSIFFKDGKWNRVYIVSPSLDVAFLVYLGEKYQGGNSQFSDFALKMLEIKIEE